ncbi:MAG: glycerol-3-phosphate 1-O-acyltransferase PlsY [Eggerthellaceae bacterium]|nr:glycerol-3-phosphate 1-O-acyltransferase PlsY [Eggerthellaceae bacterium]
MLDFVDAFILVFGASFLLGSIPFGLIVSKLFYKTDIREHGSGNIGTTNAIRTVGKVGGFLVLVLDFGKGILAGLMALVAGGYFLQLRGLDGSAGSLLGILAPVSLAPMGDSQVFEVRLVGVLLAVAFLGCAWGHVFSPWLRFKGGKGVAVAAGCFLVTFGALGLGIELAAFAVLALATRYISVASLGAATLCPFLALLFFWGNWPAVVLCCMVALTVFWAHRDNIRRLLMGTEPRVGSKKTQEGEAQ